MNPSNQSADFGDVSNQSQPQGQDQSQAPGPAAGAASLLDQAKQLLSQGNMADLLNQVPGSVKDLSTKAVTGFNKLSTTQKVVGGALLVLGVGVLARGGKSKKGKSGQADTLNELLYFVNDRVEGYKKAVAESQDAQLRGYYQQLVGQSQRFSKTLNDELRQRGGERQDSTTLKGKFYRRFMEAAATITGHDETAILASNVHGEQWAIKAYKEALSDHTLSGALRQEVERQYTQSQKTYQELKRLTAQQAQEKEHA
ncbi:PA2169 family four-helix-bundle protein [uncultured Hymenobacter sp.]|uniref:PA2169 family four-helix-bundle protein n=1 Tax=uncultured Hymenobacter sp. TaxID=170016 RepID=UPI0035CA2ABF